VLNPNALHQATLTAIASHEAHHLQKNYADSFPSTLVLKES
jgi:hypothetical protein